MTDPYSVAGQVQDVGFRLPNADWIWLLGVSGTVTATGYLVDIFGRRVKQVQTGTPMPSFTYTIPASSAGSQDGVNLLVIANIELADYPDAIGAIVNLGGNCYVDVQDSGIPSPDFKANPSRYDIQPSGVGIAFGRVRPSAAAMAASSAGVLSITQLTNYGKTVKFAQLTTSSSGDVLVATPTGANKIKVIAVSDNSSESSASNWFYRSGAAGTQISKTTYGVVGLPVGNNRDGGIRELFETAASTALYVNNSAAVALSLDIAYLDEA